MAAVLLLHPPYIYRAGSAPGVFWLICYLLVPLAGLVRLRLSGRPPPRPAVPVARLSWRGVLDGMQFVAPSVAVVVAGVIIVSGAHVGEQGWPHRSGSGWPRLARCWPRCGRRSCTWSKRSYAASATWRVRARARSAGQ